MVTDKQVRILMESLIKGKSCSASALAASSQRVKEAAYMADAGGCFQRSLGGGCGEVGA